MFVQQFSIDRGGSPRSAGGLVDVGDDLAQAAAVGDPVLVKGVARRHSSASCSANREAFEGGGGHGKDPSRAEAALPSIHHLSARSIYAARLDARFAWPLLRALAQSSCRLLPPAPLLLDPAHPEGARGILLPPKLEAGSTHENALLPATVAELKRLGIKLKEASSDAGSLRDKTEAVLDGVTTFIVGSPDNAGSRRTQRRLACYRVDAEWRISHPKREYHAGPPRLKGVQGARIWERWAALAYNLDT